MSGPAPKPTVLKLIQGNPGKRPINKNEPQPPKTKGKVRAPRRFNRESKKWFNDIVKRAESMGVMTDVDDIGVEMLVDAYAEYLALCEIIENAGFVYVTKGTKGQKSIKANPAVVMRADAWKRISSMLQQFGLTPSSRSKINTDKPESEGDILDDLLDG
ncbi:TPA: phage terminase small subunit P27 family [Photobacterium damselae]